jgi:hypothetical protein
MQLRPFSLYSNHIAGNILFGFSFLDPVFIYLYNNNTNDDDDDDDDDNNNNPIHSLLQFCYVSGFRAK